MGKLPVDWFAGEDHAVTVAAERTQYHYSRFMNFWPDRFQAPRWAERIDASALEGWPRDRPLVLATLHAGRLFMLHYALRAQGVAAATLIGGSTRNRSAVKRAKDRCAAGRGPAVFSRSQLKGAFQHVRAGNCLIVAMDKPSEHMATVDFGGAPIRLSDGAVRIAEMNEAALAACLIVETAPWRYRICLGEPMTDLSDIEGAVRRLSADFAQMLRPYPAQCGWETLDCLRSPDSLAVA